MTRNATSAYTVFTIEPFPHIHQGDDLATAITQTLRTQQLVLADGDVLVIASKVVSIAEKRHVDLTTVTAGPEARALAARTGKPEQLVQLILDESKSHFLATPKGPIIALHRLGHQLTSAGVDRADDGGAWLLPTDPDASARQLRDTISTATGATIAVVIADSDGRADRRGSTVIAIGAAGITPLRTTTHTSPDGTTKIQEETLSDLVAAAAGLVLGQRGRGAPVAVLRGLDYQASDTGVAAILHP
jgi:coenzyme F420-0:L-glutamate ligase/coenzyme F420-1:gamma-L-glutamate ligase